MSKVNEREAHGHRPDECLQLQTDASLLLLAEVRGGEMVVLRTLHHLRRTYESHLQWVSLSNEGIFVTEMSVLMIGCLLFRVGGSE